VGRGGGASVVRAEGVSSRDGEMAKAEARAATRAGRMALPGAVVWDVGAGSGSVSVEWMRAAPRTHAIAIEPRDDRCAMIRENAISLGVPGLTVIEGEAPAAFEGLPAPDAVFIGGGLAGDSEGSLIRAAMAALSPGGRLVANAVTLDSESTLLSTQAEFGGALTRIQIARVEPVGPYQGWRPLMPVTQWAWSKPWGSE